MCSALGRALPSVQRRPVWGEVPRRRANSADDRQDASLNDSKESFRLNLRSSLLVLSNSDKPKSWRPALVCVPSANRSNANGGAGVRRRRESGRG